LRMYLHANLKTMNEHYESRGISFKLDDGGKIVRVVENRKYLLNDVPELKEELQARFRIKFTKKHLWHMGRQTLNFLENKRLKFRPDRDVADMKGLLSEYIFSMSDQGMANLLSSTLVSRPEFFTQPAAKFHHHAYKNGLLEHTLQVVEISTSIVNRLVKQVDTSYVVAGAILHDIGKIECYQQEGYEIELTEIFHEQEHIVKGVAIVATEAQKAGFPEVELDPLLHIIASHHNLREWGSPISPLSQEAWVVAIADMASAKLGG